MASVTFLAIVVLSGMPYTAPGPSHGHYMYAAPYWSSCKTCRGRSGELYDYRIEFDYPWRMSPLPTVPHDYACSGCAPRNGPYGNGPYEIGPHENVPQQNIPHDARLRQPGIKKITSRERAAFLKTRYSRAPMTEMRPASADRAIR